MLQFNLMFYFITTLQPARKRLEVAMDDSVLLQFLLKKPFPCVAAVCPIGRILCHVLLEIKLIPSNIKELIFISKMKTRAKSPICEGKQISAEN